MNFGRPEERDYCKKLQKVVADLNWRQLTLEMKFYSKRDFFGPKETTIPQLETRWKTEMFEI